MSTSKRRKIDHIFQRTPGGSFYIKLQRADKRTEYSLGTSDREQAIIQSLPLIAEHKAALRAARPRVELGPWIPDYPLGVQTIDGKQVFATERELRDLATGTMIGTNGCYAKVLRPAPSGGPSFIALDRAVKAELIAAHPRKDADDDLLDAYIVEAKLNEHRTKEARSIFAQFKAMTGNKPLKDCRREDTKQLVAILAERGNKTATISRTLVPLVAMCNLAIANGALVLNPFKGVVSKKGEDSTIKLKFTADDMAAIKTNLGKLSAADALLVRLLASTGIRPDEAFQIDREQQEDGVRFVVVSTRKGKAKLLRRRRVPLPAELADLPRITGKLFDGGKGEAGKRLNAFIHDDCGITDIDPVSGKERKTLYSFRHRAGGRLDAAECPSKIRDALLGHGSATVGDGYGADGFRDATPLPILRKWIDRIGI
jgi:integrase